MPGPMHPNQSLVIPVTPLVDTLTPAQKYGDSPFNESQYICAGTDGEADPFHLDNDDVDVGADNVGSAQDDVNNDVNNSDSEQWHDSESRKAQRESDRRAEEFLIHSSEGSDSEDDIFGQKHDTRSIWSDPGRQCVGGMSVDDSERMESLTSDFTGLSFAKYDSGRNFRQVEDRAGDGDLRRLCQHRRGRR